MGYTPPPLEVRKVAGAWNVYGSSYTTGDDLTIKPNLTDTYAYLTLNGNSSAILCGNTEVILKSAASNSAVFSGTGTWRGGGGAAAGLTIQPNNGDYNGDIYLSAGTGYVKFGTKTATGDVAIDGHLDIKDSAGNVVKLATVA